MDRNGNCDRCGSPELAVVDRPLHSVMAATPGAARVRMMVLAAEQERNEVRGRWVLRLAITAVLIGAAIYARYLWRLP